jgi:hypothetical protein
MWQAKREREGLERWWVMGKSLGFVYGVPFGIAAGAISGAIFEMVHIPHGAAWGLVIGFGSAALFGGVAGWWAASRKYKWVRSERTVSEAEWAGVVMSLNVKAADQHYLMVRREADYVAYAPTLVRPVAAGPLTVSGEYLNVVVARSNCTTITITGPHYMVDEFEEAIE